MRGGPQIRDYHGPEADPAGGATAAGVGLNWYLNGGVKIATDYERTVFRTAGTARRPPENDLFSRIQFSF